MKTSADGIVTKIRVLKLEPIMLVRLTIEGKRMNYNCLVSNSKLANHILMLPEGSVHVSAYGHLNKRNQLVLEKLYVRDHNYRDKVMAVGSV